MSLGTTRTYSFNTLLELIFRFPLLAYIVGFIEDFVISIMKTGPVPKHIAMIMDGNRTYAKNHRLPLKEGHFAGANALVKVCKLIREFIFLFMTIESY